MPCAAWSFLAHFPPSVNRDSPPWFHERNSRLGAVRGRFAAQRVPPANRTRAPRVPPSLALRPAKPRRPHEPQNSCCRARGRRHGGEEASVVRRIVLIRSEEPLQEGWRRRAFGPAGALLDSQIRGAGAMFDEADHPLPAAGRTGPPPLGDRPPPSGLSYPPPRGIETHPRRREV